MEFKVPKLPNWAWIMIAGATLYGINRGVGDAVRGAGRAAQAAGDQVEDVFDYAKDAADDARKKWRGMGEGTRASLPIVAAAAALIIWKKG